MDVILLEGNEKRQSFVCSKTSKTSSICFRYVPAMLEFSIQ